MRIPHASSSTGAAQKFSVVAMSSSSAPCLDQACDWHCDRLLQKWRSIAALQNASAKGDWLIGHVLECGAAAPLWIFTQSNSADAL